MFHNANLFGSCIIHILYTGCAKIKKNSSGAKGLRAADLLIGVLLVCYSYFSAITTMHGPIHIKLLMFINTIIFTQSVYLLLSLFLTGSKCVGNTSIKMDFKETVFERGH